MRPTRRLWAIATLAVALALLAIVLATPVPLIATALIGAWLVSQLLTVSDAVDRLEATLTVDQTLDTTAIRVGETTEYTLSARLDSPVPLDVTIEPGVPVSATMDDAVTLSLTGERTEVWATTTLVWPVSGQHRFTPATVTVTDGLVTETVATGTTPTAIVEPKGVRDLHVGAGGQRAIVAYGEHTTDHTGPGIKPARIREYRPGDPADWIAWKATARLPGVYTRDFEIETDRETWLVVDRRSTLALGPPGHTKLDHLRAVGIGILQSSRSSDDPVGLLVVDDDGIEQTIQPSTDPETHRTIRNRLLTLTPPRDVTPTDPIARRQPVATAEARRLAAPLEGDDSRFALTITDYLGDRTGYHRRIADEPLYGAVTEALARSGGSGLVAILTDDAALTELTETAKRARREDQDVLVCLAPGVLYDGDTDPEAAYHDYVAFEEHRRRLAAMGRVTALEVGPSDRLGAILASGRRSRETTVIAT